LLQIYMLSVRQTVNVVSPQLPRVAVYLQWEQRPLKIKTG